MGTNFNITQPALPGAVGSALTAERETRLIGSFVPVSSRVFRLVKGQKAPTRHDREGASRQAGNIGTDDVSTDVIRTEDNEAAIDPASARAIALDGGDHAPVVSDLISSVELRGGAAGSFNAAPNPSAVSAASAALGPQGVWPLVKRLVDVMVAAPLLIIFSPFILVLWLAVRMTSPGPGLFWSTRVGRNGRTFSMPKLRSMRLGAPVQAREAFAKGHDPATPLGRFIRGYSLDELPQLWCVVIGQMSLIGPRPLLPEDPGSHERVKFPASLSVRPGVTGLAQVSGRNFVTPRRKARYDSFYAKKLSTQLDVVIFIRTLIAIFFRRGGGVL